MNKTLTLPSDALIDSSKEFSFANLKDEFFEAALFAHVVIFDGKIVKQRA